MLELQGDVTLRRGADLTVRTEQATIDLRASSASGDRPVGATSSQGTLSGTGFRVVAGGDTVFVNGPAQMQVVPSTEDGASVRCSSILAASAAGI